MKHAQLETGDKLLKEVVLILEPAEMSLLVVAVEAYCQANKRKISAKKLLEALENAPFSI